MSAAEGDLTGADWLQRWRDADYDFDFDRDERPQVYLGPFGSVDGLGRKIPRRLGIPDYLLTIARSEPARVRRVPSVAIIEEDESDAFVKCPCGAHPVAEARLVKCPGCERHYVRLDDGVVFVAYGNGPTPPLVN